MQKHNINGLLHDKHHADKKCLLGTQYVITIPKIAPKSKQLSLIDVITTIDDNKKLWSAVKTRNILQRLVCKHLPVFPKQQYCFPYF